MTDCKQWWRDDSSMASLIRYLTHPQVNVDPATVPP
jgi:hypothetical protein